MRDGWVCDYKKRWNLSSLKTKLNRNAVHCDPNELTEFMSECKKISTQIDKKYIFNLDETFWRINTANDRVIGFTNSDHRKVDSMTNGKAGFTAIFIITAEGSFMKPVIILKGKTQRSLAKINMISDNDIDKKYSVSGSAGICSHTIRNTPKHSCICTR